MPAAPRDDALVRAAGAYPFVEVVLKPARRVWDVVRHLYAKWRLPVRVMHEQRDVAVDSLVVELLEKGSRVVRVPYKVLHVDIDWAPLSALFEPPVVSAPVVNTPGRKRVLAPRDDDSFWMGVSSPAKTPPGGHSPVNLHPPREQSCGSGTEPSEHSRPGEQAVLSRLRGHLQRLDSLDKRDEANTPPLAEKSEDGVQDDDDDDDDDFAVIPEQFLRSCSRFDLAHSLPESLLSLGDSSRSRDADHAGRPHKRRKQVHAEAPARGEQDAGVVGNADVVETANDGCVRVLNDALDVARELDLRCEEDLEGMDLFRDVDLPPVVGPPLSLSALFRE